MGKMKTLGEDLKEKLEAYANAQGSRNVGMGMGMGVQQAMRNSQASQIMHAAQNVYAAQQLNMYGANQAQTGSSQTRKGPPVVDNPNKREAYVVPLSTLANMWRAKFGDVWVDVSEIDDEFWADASSRLHRNRLMEEIEFRESNTPWARLKEDA